MLSTNNISKCLEILLNVIKNIFCQEEYSSNCNKCSLCHLIDLNNLPSLKIINPDGNFIKKEQILELQHFFSKDSQYTEESIYIIKNAEKMNKEAANTMLKFLEEPTGKVIGFFLTNDKDNVMLTIKSRTQVIEVLFNNEENEKYDIDMDTYHKYLEIINNYLQKLEIEKKELILYNRVYLSDLEKEDIKKIFQIILDIYNDELSSRYKINDSFLKLDYLHKLSVDNLQKKINLLIEFLKELTYNVNTDLLLDKFVIEMDGINNDL